MNLRQMYGRVTKPEQGCFSRHIHISLSNVHVHNKIKDFERPIFGTFKIDKHFGYAA